MIVLFVPISLYFAQYLGHSMFNNADYMNESIN